MHMLINSMSYTSKLQAIARPPNTLTRPCYNNRIINFLNFDYSSSHITVDSDCSAGTSCTRREFESRDKRKKL